MAHRAYPRAVERLLVVVGLVIVAVGAAALLERRRPGPGPVTPVGTPPTHLAREDFDRPGAPWLVAVFTSASCSTCAEVWAKARLLASDEVVTQVVEVGDRPDLHRRYRVDAVPLVVVADGAGDVRATFLGPVTATDLWARVAELRRPGTSPVDGCHHGVEDEGAG